MTVDCTDQVTSHFTENFLVRTCRLQLENKMLFFLQCLLVLGQVGKFHETGPDFCAYVKPHAIFMRGQSKFQKRTDLDG